VKGVKRKGEEGKRREGGMDGRRGEKGIFKCLKF